jgi:hypothetical protein
MALPQKRSARNIIILMETINELYQTPRGGHKMIGLQRALAQRALLRRVPRRLRQELRFRCRL